ncbi:MAG TPA: hypothetical protein EYP40_03505, partial [Chromatiales bacterium]|nr:hypothetical protein [Chromatiales bacterium]
AVWERDTGRALCPVISWQDRRGKEQVRQLTGQASHIHAKTGLFLSPHYGASKIRWCLDHLPAVAEALEAKRLGYGPMAGFLVRHLVGASEDLTDLANATRTQLIDLHTLEWDEELLDLFRVPREPLPRLVPTRHDFGTLQATPAIRLQQVTGDQSAALYAYGELQPDTVYVNIGTGAFVSRPSGEVPLLGRRLLTSLIQHQPGRTEYVLEGTVNGAGAAIEWLAGTGEHPDLFARLPDWLLEANHHDILFLNGVSGLGSPFWVADFASRFVGAGESGDLRARALAVAESIVFLVQANLDELHKLASPPDHIQLTGGLAHWDGLARRLASLSGLSVYRPQECEATGRGLAFLLAGRPAHWPEEKPGEWFEPEKDAALQQAYKKWRGLMLAQMRR